MKQSLAQLVISAALLCVGSYFGLLGILIAHITRSFIISIFNVVSIQRHAGIRARSVLFMIAPPALASMAMMLVVETALHSLPAGNPWLNVALAICVGMIVYPAILMVGDLVGLWKSYVRGAANSVISTFR
jgi:hypothetical protein